MLDTRLTHKFSQKGYTLLELMVVLVLVAVIGSLVLPRVDGIYNNLVLRTDRDSILHAVTMLPGKVRSQRIAMASDTLQESGAVIADMPKGWSLKFSENILYQASGFCTGGELTLMHSSGKMWFYVLPAPYCEPLETGYEG